MDLIDPDDPCDCEMCVVDMPGHIGDPCACPTISVPHRGRLHELSHDDPRSNFTAWLAQEHITADTPTGDLARDVIADRDWPVGLTRLNADGRNELYVAHLDGCGASDGARRCYEYAYDQWRQYWAYDDIKGVLMAGTCSDCGALVNDFVRHRLWHAEIDLRTEEDLLTVEGLIHRLRINNRDREDVDRDEQLKEDLEDMSPPEVAEVAEAFDVPWRMKTKSQVIAGIMEAVVHS